MGQDSEGDFWLGTTPRRGASGGRGRGGGAADNVVYEDAGGGV